MKQMCFTGHRTLNKAYFNAGSPTTEWSAIWNWLFYTFLPEAYKIGYTDFYVGGALGVDMMAGLSLYQHKVSGFAPDININLCIPHPTYNARWCMDRDRSNLDVIKSVATTHTLFDETVPFAIWMLQRRNEFMVDRSITCTGIYDGRDHGGTRNCLGYAHVNQKQVIEINPYKPELPEEGEWKR